MGNKKTKERQFSITISAASPFEEEERELLSQLVMEEIKRGIDLIVDEVFELQSADEYIVSGNIVSANRMVKALGDYLECEIVLKEIQ